MTVADLIKALSKLPPESSVTLIIQEVVDEEPASEVVCSGPFDIDSGINDNGVVEVFLVGEPD